MNIKGRPLIWEDAEEFKRQCELYFKKITRTAPKVERIAIGYEDNDPKKPIFEEKTVVNDAGETFNETEWLTPPTLVGLARHLGVDRRTLLNYSSKDEYFPTIKAAKTRVEEYEAQRLDQRSAVIGNIFSLKNNHNWRDQTEVGITGTVQTTNYDVNDMSEGDKIALLHLLDKLIDKNHDE